MNEPLTATGLMLRLHENARKIIIKYFLKEENVVGKTIEVFVEHREGGEVGSFTCKIIKWNPPVPKEPPRLRKMVEEGK